MSLSSKSSEIQRLIKAFEKESQRFHDIRFHVYYITQSAYPDVKFDAHNHAVSLWQYYGTLHNKKDRDQFIDDLEKSDLKWGIRGAALTAFGVIEGKTCNLFVRMASRAGSLFNAKEASYLKARVVEDIIRAEKEKFPSATPTASTNDNPLTRWLNFLLYHLSMTNPGMERACKIEPDPFSLSLLALERLAVDHTIGRVDRSGRKLQDLHFKVAVSFPGEKRSYVSRIVDVLRGPLGNDAIFYDFDYQAQLARPNLDILLQRIYRDQSDLIVVFLCADYAAKQWCGLEWRAVRDIIKSKQDERVMFVKLDDANIEGLFSIDGFIDGRSHSAKQIAEFIVTRIGELEG